MTEPTAGIRRALSSAELDTLDSAMAATTSTAELVSTLIATLYDQLLTGTGRSFADYSRAQQLRPGDFAIPTRQWEVIASMACAHAQRWGAGVTIAMDLISLLPATYSDPDAPGPSHLQADDDERISELQLTRSARTVITGCEDYLRVMAGYYGANARCYRDAARSWHHQLVGLLAGAFGSPTRITADGPLSLHAAAPALHYGVIFHGVARRCLSPGCDARIADDGTVSGHAVADHEHQPSYPLGAPQPGTWSMHS
jgi:hypothetical protein